MTVLLAVGVFDVSPDASINDFFGLLDRHHDLLLFNILFEQLIVVAFQLIILVLVLSHDLLMILFRSLTANWSLFLFIRLPIKSLPISYGLNVRLLLMGMVLWLRKGLVKVTNIL